MKALEKALAQELMQRGLLSKEAFEKFLKEAQVSNEDLRDYLLRRQIVDEKQVLGALSVVYNLPAVDLRSMSIDTAVIERVPVRFAWYYKFLPVRIEGNTLTLASAAPLDVKLQDEIRTHLGLEPKIVLARKTDVLDGLNKYYGLAADTVDRLAKDRGKGEVPTTDLSQWVENLEEGSEEASVAKLVNQILLEAYKKRATDIHIEPYRHKVRVRYRIDGVLVDANVPPSVRQFLPSIISRIKIMSNLSIVEKRLPQDGSAVVRTKEKDLDLRISTIPTPWGESVVIRILPSDVMLLSLEKLGLDQRNLERFREMVRKPHGIVLVTGPTGSGKTTTLYACLNEINTPDRKIITLEDPLEYEMEGITQIQVNMKVKLDFATGLRSVLRHDPDVIMVGEIRDRETAEIAIRTALTGHMVYSTLHTNDAASGVTRLIEMGLEPFLIASSVEAFVAQRLVRKVCPDCRTEITTLLPEIREEIAESLNIPLADVKLYQGSGCDRCNKTGFYGRTALYELLVMNDEIRTAILNKQRADTIKQTAMRAGMTTLRKDAWRKVVAGVTSPSEVLNVTVRDEEMPSAPQAAGVAGQSQGQTAPTTPAPRVRHVNDNVLKAKDEFNSRVYMRHSVECALHYAIVRQDPVDMHKITTDSVEHKTVTVDMSAGGLKFLAGYKLPVGTLLELRVQVTPVESFSCLGKICRVEENTQSATFVISVYFLDISSADRFKVDQFVRQQLAQVSDDSNLNT